MRNDAKAPQLSIVVPVYNVEAYLRRCIDSILAQTFADWECICVNDGSTDGCGAILDEYAARDARFVVIHIKENCGVGGARNAGLDVARGEFIGFVDSDDWIEPNTYELALAAAQKSGADIVQWRIACEKESGTTFSSEKSETFSGIGACGGAMDYNVWSKLFRAAFLAENRLRFLPGTRYAEDFYFSVIAYGHCKKGAFINLPLYHYDQTRQTSIMHNCYQVWMEESREAFKGQVDAIRQMEQMIKEQGVTVIAGGGQTIFSLGLSLA